jgi:hypothetical protein
MERNCAASGCTSFTAGYSNFCSSHRKTLTRHGHPQQSPVTVHELRPYLRMVSARRTRNGSNAAWAILVQRWSTLVQHAEQRLGAFAAGRADVRHGVQAAEQVRNLAGTVAADLIIDTALAMFLIRQLDPRRFRSDRAFDHQLVRRVRGLAPTSMGSYWDHRTRKTKRVYRDMPPRVVLALAEQLKGAFGVAGIQLADLEHQQVNREAAERQRLADAIGAMQ